MQPHYTTIPTTSGIYRIVCATNGKVYIGSTANLRKRSNDHFAAFRRNAHPNQKLQRAFNKYGEAPFTFEVLEFVLPPFLLEREQYWLDKCKPFGKQGFNIACSTQSNNLGMVASAETREKLRISHLGQPGYWTGKNRSPDTIEKIRLAKSINPGGRPSGCEITLEHREKLRQANLGKKQSEATIRKRAEKQIGRKKSAASVEKTRLANLGRKNTPEACNNMRLARVSEMKTLIVTSPDGIEYSIVGIRQFCKEHNLDRSTLMKVAKGKCNQHKGWTARFPS